MLQDELGLACQRHTEITGYTIGAQTHTNPTSTNNFAYLTGRNFGLAARRSSHIRWGCRWVAVPDSRSLVNPRRGKCRKCRNRRESAAYLRFHRDFRCWVKVSGSVGEPSADTSPTLCDTLGFHWFPACSGWSEPVSRQSDGSRRLYRAKLSLKSARQ